MGILRCDDPHESSIVSFAMNMVVGRLLGHDFQELQSLEMGTTRETRNMLTAILYCKYIPNMLIISLRLFGAMSRLPAK